MADYDVVIVGAGVAGGLVADALTKAGKKVIVLEAGPNDSNRTKLVKRYQLAAIKTPESPYANEAMAPRPEVMDLDAYYVQKGAQKFKSTYLRRVGGTTWHWLGVAFRFLPNDFKIQTAYQRGLDWPFQYDALEPWYVKAEKELGVSGDDADDIGSPRSGGYPNAPTPTSYMDKVIKDAVTGTTFDGNPVKVSVTPAARNPEVCIGSTSCIPICPMGAKYEAIRHVTKAKNGGAVIQDKCVASKILVGADGSISGLEYTQWDGTKKTVTGKAYVLAANAIETPKLMLMSVSEAFPKGVGNSSDQVGRNLCDHPIQLSWALTKDKIYPYRGPLSTSGIESLRDGAFRKDRGGFRVQISNDGWNWPTGGAGTIAQTLASEKKLFGKKLAAAVKDRGQREIQLASLIEQLPDASNRVIPSEMKDALGIPRPELHYALGEYEKKGMEAAKKAHDQVFQQLGCTEIQHRDEHEGAGHIMGTVRMGADQASSVVDADGRSHDHKNLYVVGASVFPSVGTANPTLTIAALALKTAARIGSDLG